jgi:hypothetical protein
MAISNQFARSSEEVSRLGSELLRRLEPSLPANDADKFIAIDIDSGDFEVDADDLSAVTRLRARRPSAESYLGRIGHDTAYRIRRKR